MARALRSSLPALVMMGTCALAQDRPPRNLILFVPDGLRASSVTPETAPAMAAVRDGGVNFANPHSLFPTFTMANASGLATGHYLGDTGVFSNTIYTGKPVSEQNGTVVPFIEHDRVLRDLDEQFGGDFVNEDTILKKARAAGFSTAAQQSYMADAATKVVLPLFKARARPFVLVFWSRDPDGTQHNHGDSLNSITPGINGPSSLAAIRNADNNLAQLRKALTELGLADSTNIMVAADHGFSTISKESKTSSTVSQIYPDTPEGFLPRGFLTIDLAKALGLPLFDPIEHNAPVGAGAFPRAGNGVIGQDPTRPDVVVATSATRQQRRYRDDRDAIACLDAEEPRR